jgi:putative ABC transport system permease protein
MNLVGRYLIEVAALCRQAARTLRRSRGFAVVVLATLALGVGANAAVFSVIAALLGDVPGGADQPANIRRVYQTFSLGKAADVHTRDVFSYREFDAIRRAAPAGVQVGAFSAMRVTIRGGASQTDVLITTVSPGYFETLGMRPLLGRLDDVEASDAAPGNLAVISYRLWQQLFNGAPDAVGRSISIGGRSLVVSAVAPKSFSGLDLEASDAWVSPGAVTDSASLAAVAGNANDLRAKIIVRIQPHSEPLIETNFSRALLTVPSLMRNPEARVSLVPLSRLIDPGPATTVVPIMLALGGAVVVILALSFANIATLVLARVADGARDRAIRLAMGSSRRRIYAALATEGILLSLIGAGCALVLGTMMGNTLRSTLIPDVHYWSKPILGWRGASWTFWLALVIGTGATVLPALWIGTFADDSTALRHSQSAVSGRVASGWRATLSFQIALSVVLIAAAGVFVSSLNRVAQVGIGYRTDDIVMIAANNFAPNDPESLERGQFLERVAVEMSRHPEAEDLTLTSTIPIVAIYGMGRVYPDHEFTAAPGRPFPALSVVAPNFFRLFDLRIKRGRHFLDSDTRSSAPVAMVSVEMAREFWPGDSAVGRCLRVPRTDAPCRTVVGVVDDVNAMKILEPPTPRYYVPMSQAPRIFVNPSALIIRSKPGSERAVLVAASRAVLNDAWASRIFSVQPFANVTARELQPRRLSAMLFALLGLLAVLVAGIGVYGFTAYSVSKRIPEMGLRRALGAEARHIVWCITAPIATAVTFGAGIGLVLLIALGRTITGMLYGITPHDPFVLFLTMGTIALLGLVFSLVPLMRALRVPPLVALAGE